ncbi:MAG: ATP-grasp domain-containing protein [Muribaculum sp.]|nr:ATP-grasp domain-containing protein [Muribaculum sp.]
MKRILVLAGGSDQADLMDLLRDKFPGCYIILADMAPKVIAASHADKHLLVSTMDFEAVKKAAIGEKVDCIMTACGDQPLITMATISEELGMPCYLTKDEALSMTNKLHMKRIMVENGIPTSKFKTVSDINEDISELKYPLMVKPADCNGSLGVRKANNHDQFVEFFSQAQKYSFSHSAIVEEFKEGKEVGIDCYTLNGKTQILMMGEVRKKKIGDSVLLIYQTYIPANISEKAKENLQKVADDIARVFRLNNTPILIQTLVNGDDVSVIEFAPRIGGASKHRTVTLKTGFDILKANIDAMFGETPNVETHPDSNFFSRNHVYAYPCTFSHVENAEKLIEDGIIEEFIPYKMEGAPVGEFLASRDRIGSFLVKAPTMDELKRKIKIAVETLKVFDINGRDVMKREIWDFDD